MSFQTRRLNGEPAPRSFPWRTVLFAGAIVASPAVKLWRLARERRVKEQAEGEAHRSLTLRLLRLAGFMLLGIFIVLLLLAGTVKVLIATDILNLKSILGATAAELPKDENGFTNILLLGKGDDDHDGVDLTDTMMIASIDRTTKSTVLLSIPRDLYVFAEVMGKGRINMLYRDYKIALKRKGIPAEETSQIALRELMRELGKDLHLQIHHAVMVNFSGFVQAVDALGGIDVVVPYDIVDREYPGPNWTYQTFEIHAGPAHLDGETALKYARSRHTTSDFGRSARQQQIIQALGEKAKTMGILTSPRKALSIYRILSSNIETTMSPTELLGAVKLGEELDKSRVISMQLSDRSGYPGMMPEPGGFLYDPPRAQFNGASVLLPVHLPTIGFWGQIRTFLMLLTTQRELYLHPPRIAILNAGAANGQASLLAGELTRYGFNVERAENADIPKKIQKQQDFTGILVLDDKLDTAVAGFFGSLLNLSAPKVPVPLPPEQRAQITIVLGTGYSFEPIALRIQPRLETPEPLLEEHAGSGSATLSGSSIVSGSGGISTPSSEGR